MKERETVKVAVSQKVLTGFQNLLWQRFASRRDGYKDGIRFVSYSQEGLVVVLVPASTKTSRPLQERVQRLDLGREASIQ